MKLLAENKVENKKFENIPEALEQVKTILTGVLFKAVENKIDWNVYPIDNLSTNYTASIHVMNNAEWKAAKDILKEIIKTNPQTEAEILRIFAIVDPLGNF